MMTCCVCLQEVLKAFLLYMYLNLRPLEKDKKDTFQYEAWYLCVPLPPYVFLFPQVNWRISFLWNLRPLLHREIRKFFDFYSQNHRCQGNFGLVSWVKPGWYWRWPSCLSCSSYSQTCLTICWMMTCLPPNFTIRTAVRTAERKSKDLKPLAFVYHNALSFFL